MLKWQGTSHLLWGNNRNQQSRKTSQNIPFQTDFSVKGEVSQGCLGEWVDSWQNNPATPETRSFLCSECWKAFRFIKLKLLRLNISKGRGGRGSLSPTQPPSSSSWLYSVGNREQSQHLPSIKLSNLQDLDICFCPPSPSPSLWQPQMEKTEGSTTI